jgi:hypothetical protein
MLECNIILHNNLIKCVHKNKNSDYLSGIPDKHILRYFHFLSNAPVEMKRNIIVGCIHRFVANTSPAAYYLLWEPIWDFFWELKQLQYPWSFIAMTMESISLKRLPIYDDIYNDFANLWHGILLWVFYFKQIENLEYVP